MSNTFPLKTLSDLKQGIQDGRIATKAPVAILAVLDLTAKALGQSRMQDPAPLASEAHLTTVLPRDPDAGLLAVFGDAAIYKRCWKGLFRQCQLAGLWDDPYSGDDATIRLVSREEDLVELSTEEINDVLIVYDLM